MPFCFEDEFTFSWRDVGSHGVTEYWRAVLLVGGIATLMVSIGIGYGRKHGEGYQSL